MIGSPRLLRGLCAALILAAAPAAWAQQPAAPPLSPEDAKTVYNELLQTHDGFVYTLYLLRFSTEEAAARNWAQLQKPPFHVQRFERIYKSATPRTVYLFVLDPAIRERIVTLYEGQRMAPVAVRDGWIIAELVARKPSQAPPFATVEPNLPGLVAAGLLPSAEQLRSDPALRKRSAANAIRTVDDLSAAPSDLNLNVRLSSYGTVLTRALTLERTDLVQALLARGANPNLCARRSCPLHAAVYSGSRPSVEALLKAGADANQADPAVGVPIGPLGAAAYRGDADIVERLVAAGARVNGEAKGETPLMAAATAANRQMIELLVAKGADLFKLDGGAPERGVLDSARVAKNAEFSAWLRALLLKTAASSGRYVWQGWIEQEGKRTAMGDKPIMLRKAPFRIIVRMDPERMLYVATSSEQRLFEEFRTQRGDGALFSTMNVSAEGEADKELVVHGPAKPGERWGGSQNWFKKEGHSRFAAVNATAEGMEFVREVTSLFLLDAAERNDPIPIASYTGDALYLVVGTRVRLTVLEDAVFASRNVELRFAK